MTEEKEKKEGRNGESCVLPKGLQIAETFHNLTAICQGIRGCSQLLLKLAKCPSFVPLINGSSHRHSRSIRQSIREASSRHHASALMPRSIIRPFLNHRSFPQEHMIKTASIPCKGPLTLQFDIKPPPSYLVQRSDSS